MGGLRLCIICGSLIFRADKQLIEERAALIGSLEIPLPTERSPLISLPDKGLFCKMKGGQVNNSSDLKGEIKLHGCKAAVAQPTFL
jgi:hypothetical protein